MSTQEIIIPPTMKSRKVRRMVTLLDVEPAGCPTDIHGYGFASVAYWAGVRVESAIRAAARGMFTLGDMPSIARYILRRDARRKSGLKSARRKRERGEAIQARIKRQVVR